MNKNKDWYHTTDVIDSSKRKSTPLRYDNFQKGLPDERLEIVASMPFLQLLIWITVSIWKGHVLEWGSEHYYRQHSFAVVSISLNS